MTRRLDLATTASRLLLENVTFSESVTLQRCARLLSEALGAWVIVDMDRSGLLRRHFVTGPDKHESGPLAQAVAAVNPEPGSLPAQVRESGSTLLVTHAEDNDILGAGPGGVPLLALLGSSSVLSVPLADSEQAHGVLTLARDPARGYFSLADVGLVESGFQFPVGEEGDPTAELGRGLGERAGTGDRGEDLQLAEREIHSNRISLDA